MVASTQVANAAQLGSTAAAELSPQQQAATMLDGWESCIDAAVKEQARQNARSGSIARLAETGCASHGVAIKPVLKSALRAMMFSSSDREVSEQSDVAFGVLRRHIHSRAVSAANKIQAGQSAAGR
jgi:hypothetical protein